MATNSRTNTAYKQLQQALDAATTAAKSLRGDLSSNATLRDLEKRISELRKEIEKNGRSWLAEIEGRVSGVTGRKPAARKPAAKKATARKPAAKKATARKPAAKKAAAKPASRTTARKPAAKKAAAKPASRATARKPAAKKATARKPA